MPASAWVAFWRLAARRAALACLAWLPVAAAACEKELLFVGNAGAEPGLYLHGEGCEPALRRLSAAGELVFDAQWSPDGTRIAYVAAVGRYAQVFLLDLRSGERRQLTEGEHLNAEPRWSPDGRSLVFVSQRDGAGQLHRIEADGSGRRRLSTLGAPEASPSWSPDGSRIAFVRIAAKRDLWVMDADGDNAQALAFGPADEDSPLWTPDGRQLVYALRHPQHTEFRRVDLHSGETALLLRQQGMAQSASFSPDGRRLAFLSNSGGQPMSLWLAAADGSDARRLSQPSSDEMSPQWSADGRELVFVGLVNARPQLLRMDVQGGSPSALLQRGPEQQLMPLPRPRIPVAGTRLAAQPAD